MKVKIKQSEWKKMEEYAAPNETHGRQKIDKDGIILEWVSGGGRTARIICKVAGVRKWNEATINTR